MTIPNLALSSDTIKSVVLPQISKLEAQLPWLMPAETEYSFSYSEQHSFSLIKRNNRIAQGLCFSLRLSVNHSPLILELDETLVIALLSGISQQEPTGALPFKLLPHGIQLALLQTAISPLTDQIMNTLGIQVQLDELLDSKLELAEGVRQVYQCQLGSETGWAAITFTDDMLDWIQILINRLSSSYQKSLINVEDLPLNLSVILGATRLAWHEIKQLHVHDIVLLDTSFKSNLTSSLIESTLPVELVIQGQALFHGLLKGHQIEITHTNKERQMENDTQDYVDDFVDGLTGESIEREESIAESLIGDSASYLDELPLTLTYEVARQTTTLKQVKSLLVGQTISLNRPPQPSVTLVINGKAIAEADLVQIEDKIGARVTRILLPKAGSEA